MELASRKWKWGCWQRKLEQSENIYLGWLENKKVTVLFDIFISQKYQKTPRRLFCNSAHIKYDFFWSQSPLLYAFAQRKYLIIASCFKIRSLSEAMEFFWCFIGIHNFSLTVPSLIIDLRIHTVGSTCSWFPDFTISVWTIVHIVNSPHMFHTCAQLHTL